MNINSSFHYQWLPMDTDLELIRFEIYQTLIPSFNLLLPRKASTISSPTSSTHTDSSETGAYIYGYTHRPPSEAVNTLSCAYTSIRIKYAFASYKLIAPRAHAHTHTRVWELSARARFSRLLSARRALRTIGYLYRADTAAARLRCGGCTTGIDYRPCGEASFRD